MLELDHQAAVAFWQWFGRKQSELLALVERPNDDHGAVTGQLDEELGRYGLTWLIGGPHGGSPEFIVTADGRAELFPAVDLLVAAAPDFSPWKIIALKPPMDPALELEVGSVRLDTRACWYHFTDADGSRNLTVGFHGLATSNREEARIAIILAVEAMLGERALATGIDVIRLETPPKAPELAGWSPLVSLPSLLRTRGGSAP